MAYRQLKTDGFLMLSFKPEIIELTDTSKIKLGDLEIERPVEMDPLDEIFVDKHKKVKREKMVDLIPKVKTKAWTNKIPRTQVKYTKEIVERVREVVDEMKNQEIRDLLQKEFGINVSVPCVVSMMVNKGIKREKNHSKEQNKHEIGIIHYNNNGKYLCNSKWKANPKKLTYIGKDVTCDNCKCKLEKEEEPKLKKFYKNEDNIHKAIKTKRKGMSEEAIEIIEENYMEKTDGELRELIADKIGAFHAVDKIEEYRETNGMIRPMGWNPEDYDDDYPEDEE